MIHKTRGRARWAALTSGALLAGGLVLAPSVAGLSAANAAPVELDYTCAVSAGGFNFTPAAVVTISVTPPANVDPGADFPVDISATVDLGDATFGPVTNLAGNFDFAFTVGDQATTVNLPVSTWTGAPPVVFTGSGTKNLKAPMTEGDAPISVGMITGNLTASQFGITVAAPCTPKAGQNQSVGSTTVGSDDPDPTGIAYTCMLNAGAGPLSQPSFVDIDVSTPESVTSGGSFPADITATIDMGEPNLGSITGLAGTFALPITVGDQTTTVNLPSSAWASGDPVTFDLDGTGDLVAPAAAGEAPISIGTITGTLTPTPSGSPLNVPCTPNEGADTALGSINVEEVIPDPVPVPVTGKPAITGTPKVGKKLTAVPGQAAGATITYQWLSNGSPIKKATGKTLKLGSSLKGKKVAVMVMYAKDGFLDVMQTSKAVKVKNK